MFCLRSWLPLLFIPTNASPSFIFIFFVCTYFLNRPCFYCSVLLLILFLTSCNWSDRCFFDFGSNWFQSRPAGSSAREQRDTEGGGLDGAALQLLGTTASALVGAAADELTRRRSEWTGLGIEWLRTLLGRREWSIQCLDVNIRL